jgi:hypothetical protein
MKIALATDSFVEGQGVDYSATDPSHKHADPVVMGMLPLRYERFHGGRISVDPARWTSRMESYDAVNPVLSSPFWQKYYLQPREQNDDHDRPLLGSQV